MPDLRKEAFATTAKAIIKQLERRNMEGYFCEDCADAVELVKSFVPEGSSIGWGGTATFEQSGVKAMLKAGNYRMLDRSTAEGPDEMRAMYLAHLGADCFFMSANALTVKGELVNIDGNSNRLACLLYGPKQVIVLAGMNKIVADVESGVKRIQTMACPANALRMHPGTPCERVGVCGNCHEEGCMCCNVVVTRHNRHTGRIKVVLIAEDLGF